MKQLCGVINLDEEFSSLVSFVKSKWTTVEGFESLMRKAWEMGINLYKEKAESNYRVSNKICDMGNDIDKYMYSSLEDIEKTIIARYHPYKLFSKSLFSISMRSFLKDTDLNYYDLEKQVKEFIEEYSVYKKMKPLGWDELEKVYTEYMGMEKYNLKADKDLFTGTDVEPHDRSFMLKISLPQVMYDELEQGNDRIVVLLMSVVDHASKCIKHNNAIALLNDIEKIEDYFSSLKDNYPMPFNVSFENVINNKWLKDALKISKEDMISLGEFKEKIEKQKEYENLPEEEKQRRKAQSAEVLLNMLKNKNLL